MTLRGLIFIVGFWIAAVPMASAEAVGASTAATTVTRAVEKPARAAPVDANELARYAAREKRTPKELGKFRGGEGVSIYLGGGVVALALVVVIALLIL